MLDKIEAARLVGLQLCVEGRDRGLPIALTHLAVQIMLKKRGIVLPDDIFAFLSEGQFSDRHVTNWHSPVGA